MQKKFINRFNLVGVLSVFGAIFFTMVSCDKEENAKTNSVDFTAAVGTTYKATAPTGIPVSFTNNSANATTYSWNFGDGSPLSEEQSPTHVYGKKGTYTVELTAGAAPGVSPAIAKKTLEVVVTDPTASLPNLIVGGAMEAADAASWTRIYSGQKNGAGEFQHVDGTFGSTSNKPAGGVGGGFNAKVPAGLVGEAGSIYYQAITLIAGTYKFSADVKHDAETPDGPARSFKEYWFELYLGNVQPTFVDPKASPDLNGYNYDATAALTGFLASNWVDVPAAYKPWPATDGVMPQDVWILQSPADTDKPYIPRKPLTIADRTGVVTLTAGTYYMVFKTGFGGTGGLGANGITIDNLRLVKLN